MLQHINLTEFHSDKLLAVI